MRCDKVYVSNFFFTRIVRLFSIEICTIIIYDLISFIYVLFIFKSLRYEILRSFKEWFWHHADIWEIFVSFGVEILKKNIIYFFVSGGYGEWHHAFCNSLVFPTVILVMGDRIGSCSRKSLALCTNRARLMRSFFNLLRSLEVHFSRKRPTGFMKLWWIISTLYHQKCNLCFWLYLCFMVMSRRIYFVTVFDYRRKLVLYYESQPGAIIGHDYEARTN